MFSIIPQKAHKAVLCLIAVAGFEQQAISQKEKHGLTIKETNASLLKVLEDIGKKKYLGVSYISREIRMARPVNIDVINCPLDSVLLLLSQDQPLHIKRIRKMIHVWRKTAADTISLLVYDKKGFPVPCFSVLNSKRKLIGLADTAGRANIPKQILEEQATITHIGYKDQLVNLQKDTIVYLTRKSIELEKAVAIGYGTSNRKLFSGGIGTINILPTGQAGDLAGLLDAGATGLRPVRLTGATSGRTVFEIHGSQSVGEQGGLRNIDGALIVINGVPYYQDFMNPSKLSSIAGDRSGGGAGPEPLAAFSDIDIQDIQVLKDAVATALFGARGANGVILITTRQPSDKRMNISARSMVSYNEGMRIPNLLDNVGLRNMRRKAFANDTLPVSGNAAADMLKLDSTVNSNWPQWMFKNRAINQSSSISLSGTQGPWSLLMTGAYRIREYPLPVKAQERWGTINTTIAYTSPNKKWQFNTTVLYSNGHMTGPVQDPYNAIFLVPMISRLYDTSGAFNYAENGVGFNNPLVQMNNTYLGKINQWVTNTQISYKVSPRTTLSMNLGYMRQTMWEAELFRLTGQPPGGTGTFNAAASRQIAIMAEPQIDHQLYAGPVKARLTGGLSLQRHNAAYRETDSSDFNDDVTLEAAARSIKVGGSDNPTAYRLHSAFGRVSFDAPGHVSGDMLARADGSSKLPRKHAWGFFAAAGIAWRISEMPFLEKVRWLDFAKLRLSYGSTGNDHINNMLGYELAQSDSIDVKWSVTRKLEVALDVRMLDEVDVKIGYYRNANHNQYLQIPSSPIGGQPLSIIRNSPLVVANTGWELEACYRKKINPRTSLIFDITATFPRNVLLRSIGTPPYTRQSGGSLSSNMVYQYIGVSKDQKFIVRDVNEDGKITPDSDAVLHRDLEVKAFANCRATLKIGRFIAAFNVEARKQPAYAPMYYLYYRLVPGNASTELFSNQPEGFDQWPALTTKTMSQRVDIKDYLNSDIMYTDGSYILLKKVVFDYRLPRKWFPFLKDIDVNIYLQGDNLLLITGYPQIGNPVIQQPVGLPLMRTYSSGIVVNFTKDKK